MSLCIYVFTFQQMWFLITVRQAINGITTKTSLEKHICHWFVHNRNEENCSVGKSVMLVHVDQIGQHRTSSRTPGAHAQPD